MEELSECYFCGKPKSPLRCSGCKIARYCNADCQKNHWKLEASETAHKPQCKAFRNNHRIVIDKADYYPYISTLPYDELEEIEYANSANRCPDLVALENRVGYPLPGPANQFFRTHEFIQHLVAHGEDTDENMKRLYGFEMTMEEKKRNPFAFPEVRSLWQGMPCSSRENCHGSCQGLCRRIPCDPFRVVGRIWVEARIAVACGVGAAEGTHAYAMGARAPSALPEGQGASLATIAALQSWCLPLSVIKNEYRIISSEEQLDCCICHETIPSDDGSALLQLLPNCHHVLHRSCAAVWLQRNASCPMCRKILPETIPRPPTLQECNLAARLQKHKETEESSMLNIRQTLADPMSWSGKYKNKVQLAFRVSDDLDFSGGACSIAVSPSGAVLTLTSTSLGKVAFYSTETSSLIGTVRSGNAFHGGPGAIVYDVMDPSETSVVVVEDDMIVKYRFSLDDATDTSSAISLDRDWSVKHNREAMYLSMDQSGRVLASDWACPRFWLSRDGTDKVTVDIEDTDGESFHNECLEEDGPGGGALALPNGDIVFLHALASKWREDICLGLLRKGERIIEKKIVHGLSHADLGGGFWHFCGGPRGDLFIALPPEFGNSASRPRLIHITVPVQGDECHGSCTVLQGFRAFEEFGGVTVDKDNCVFLLVVCNWPSEREVYVVNPRT